MATRTTRPARSRPAAAAPAEPPAPRPRAKPIAPAPAAAQSPAEPPPQASTKESPKESPKDPAREDKRARKVDRPRPRLVRDSFTMPEADFALIGTLKARAMAGQRETRKSELLRAGLQALAAMESAALLAALHALEPVKTGRPKKKR